MKAIKTMGCKYTYKQERFGHCPIDVFKVYDYNKECILVFPLSVGEENIESMVKGYHIGLSNGMHIGRKQAQKEIFKILDSK